MATTVGHEPHVWRPLYVASITLTTLGILSICLRLYASLQRTSGGLKWDLVWCILSSLFAIASVGPLHVAINNGMGLHITQVTYPEIVTLIEYNEIASTLGLFSITFAKFSIIALLLEVQGSLIKYRAYVLYFVAVVLGLSTVITLSATWTQCRPVQKTWDVGTSLPHKPGYTLISVTATVARDLPRKEPLDTDDDLKWRHKHRGRCLPVILPDHDHVGNVNEVPGQGQRVCAHGRRHISHFRMRDAHRLDQGRLP